MQIEVKIRRRQSIAIAQRAARERKGGNGDHNHDEDDEDDDSDKMERDGKKHGTEGEQWDEVRPVHQSFCDAFFAREGGASNEDQRKSLRSEVDTLRAQRLHGDGHAFGIVEKKTLSAVDSNASGGSTSNVNSASADESDDDSDGALSSADVALGLLWDYLQYAATINRGVQTAGKKRQKANAVREDIVADAMVSFLNLLSLEGFRGARKRFMERCADGLKLQTLRGEDGDGGGVVGSRTKRRRFKDKGKPEMPVSCLSVF